MDRVCTTQGKDMECIECKHQKICVKEAITCKT